MPTNRMHRGLVTLSASAVAAIYMAGYLRTQSADASIGAAALPTAASVAVVVAAPAVTTPTPSPLVQPFVQPQVPVATRAAPTAQPTVAPARTVPPQSPAQQAPGSLKDGTYTGQGSSRRGDVWVSVEVQSGRIANVTITRSTLQYPLRDIAGLPSQVVQRQSAQVDIVSRATYSSQAFRGAVSQALSKAA
jgi:uncharacterized protein with FMN-binding domain